MANKITTSIEFLADKANSSLGSFRQSLADAEGAGGKLKAGFGQVSQAIQAHAGEIALGAGGALVTFGIKAVHAFEDTAKASLDLGAATGLSTEAASRWIGVGDDFQVTAEDLTSSIGKIGKTLDGKSWDKYGIATRDAGGHARDTNAILIDALAKLSSITNATERAKAGNELFGKGYAKLAPLIGHTKDEYEKMLGSVEKGQVITAQEAAKAERMRLAEDQLQDALKEVTLAFGEQVAGLSPLIVKMAQLVDLANKLEATSPNIAGSSNAFKLFGDTIDNIKGAWAGFNHEGAKAQAVMDAATAATQETDRETRRLPEAWETTAVAEKDAAEAAAIYAAQVDTTNRQVQSDIDAMKNKWDELHGHISQEQALIHYRQDVADTKQAMIDAGTAAKEHGVGSPEHVAAIENARLKQLALESETADLAQQYSDMPPEVVTDLIAQIDSGSIDSLPEEIQAAIDRKKYRVSVHLDTIGSDGETHAAGHASGGMIPMSEGLSLVGEQGPELISAPGSRVFTAGQTKSMLGGPSIINHIYGITDARELARQQAREIGWALRST